MASGLGIKFSNSNDQEDAEKAEVFEPSKAVPTKALKRFAERLQDGDYENAQFYELNQGRINEFLNKEDKDSIGIPGSNVETTHMTSNVKIAGVYDYKDNYHNHTDSINTSLFYEPESNKALGSRSRFGDGDGSYWDKWINSDAIALVNTGKLCSDRPHIGYKRLYKKPGGSPEKHNMVSENIIKPYAVRNAERKAKEERDRLGLPAEVKEEVVSYGNSLHAVFEEVKGMEAANDAIGALIANRKSKDPDSKVTALDFKFPPIVAVDKETYFGDKARASFYDFYRQVGRQRYALDDPSKIDELIITQKAPAASRRESLRDVQAAFKQKAALGPLDDDSMSGSISPSKSRRGSTLSPSQTRRASAVGEPPITGSLTPSSPGSMTPGVLSRRASLRQESFKASVPPRQTSFIPEKKNVALGSSIPTYRHRPASNQDKLKRHLDIPAEEQVAAFGNPDAPVSPRTKFVVNCIANNVDPKPHLLIRKFNSPFLDMAGQSIGDKLAQILSLSLDGLPYLYGLNIANNKLTDAGLSAVIEILHNCRSLTSLDISENKIDLLAAAALSDYLVSPECQLRDIVLNKADIDDNEAGKFVAELKKCKTIRRIEMSGNLLGSHEVAHMMNPDQITCGMSIGDLLDDETLSIETLILSWNMIRGESAARIAQSFKYNNSLTHLDLSYNKLSEAGGQLIGNALFSHKTMRRLDVSSNEITAKACFVIVAGIHACKTLSKINISDNPIGEVGMKAIMMLHTILGDEVEIDMKGCSVRLKDPTCTFDYEKPDKHYTLDMSLPYERAICAELLRIASYYDYESLVGFKYTPDQKKNPGAGAQQLEFEICITDKQPRCAIRMKKLKDRQEVVNDISTNQHVAKQLFDLYAVDNKHGGLGKPEMVRLFKELGLIHAYEGSSGSSASVVSIVNKMFDYYDFDGSGTIHEKEFFEFMNTLTAEITKHTEKSTSHRFLAVVGSKTPYIPPEDGKVDCGLLIDSSVPSFLTALSHENTTTLIAAAKNASDGTRVMNYALNNVLLKSSEAITLYGVLLKEMGSKFVVLQKLLPRMMSYDDSRLLLTHVTKGDITEKMIIKHKLGSCFRLYIGHPNGFYTLNLALVSDKMCLKKLVELNTLSGRERINANFGDCSQHGNWSCFRNTVLDGRKVLVDPSFFTKIDECNSLFEFDFLFCRVPDVHELQVVTNMRLCNLLSQLHMTDSADALLAVLSDDEYLVQQELSGNIVNGHWEMDHHTSLEAFKQLEWCYEHYDNRDLDAVFTAQSLEEFILMSLGVSTNPDGTIRPISPLKAASRGVTPPPPKVMRKRGFIERPAVVRKVKEVHKEEVAVSKAKNYSEALRKIHESDIIDKEVLAMRTIDALEDALCGRLITASQLVIMVKALPGGTMKKNNFGTMRVELIVSFFSKVIDLLNFERVLKVLTSHEIGMLMFRIGILNMWSPIKAASYYYLNLARREEKQVARLLLILSHCERSVVEGKDSEPLQDICYRPDGIVDHLEMLHTKHQLTKADSSTDFLKTGVEPGTFSASHAEHDETTAGADEKKPAAVEANKTDLGDDDGDGGEVDADGAEPGSDVLTALPEASNSVDPDPMDQQESQGYEDFLNAVEEVDNANVMASQEELKAEQEGLLIGGIPLDWFTEVGLPNTGTLIFKYHHPLALNNKIRIQLMGIGLPQLHISKMAVPANILSADGIMADTPYRFSFKTENQKPQPHYLPIANYHTAMTSRKTSITISRPAASFSAAASFRTSDTVSRPAASFSAVASFSAAANAAAMASAAIAPGPVAISKGNSESPSKDKDKSSGDSSIEKEDSFDVEEELVAKSKVDPLQRGVLRQHTLRKLVVDSDSDDN